MADLDFPEKVLVKNGFIASDAPTNHLDPRMHWKLEDMARFYNPPLKRNQELVELVIKPMRQP
jgi:hypothetical protein